MKKLFLTCKVINSPGLASNVEVSTCKCQSFGEWCDKPINVADALRPDVVIKL